MYQQTKTKGRAIRPSLQIAILKLFFLFAAFGRFGCSRLRLRFFHRLLGFGGTLGASLGALLALFLLQFLAAQQFDECLLSAVALLPSCTDNPQEASLAVAKTRANRVKQLIHGFAGHEIGPCLAPGGKVAAFAESNHLFNPWP